MYWNYLELYKENLLSRILPYLTEYHKEITDCVHKSLKILTKEILNIYHLTRKHKNENIYKHLSKSFKDILFEIHKIYINNKSLGSDNFLDSTSITYMDVHQIIKNYPILDLLKIFEDRHKLIDSLNMDNIKIENILEPNDSYIITLTHLLENE